MKNATVRASGPEWEWVRDSLVAALCVVGERNCVVRELPGGSPMTLSVQVMDLAGNVSELSSTPSVRACSVGSGGALMALALLLARRRRG